MDTRQHPHRRDQEWQAFGTANRPRQGLRIIDAVPGDPTCADDGILITHKDPLARARAQWYGSQTHVRQQLCRGVSALEAFGLPTGWIDLDGENALDACQAEDVAP